MTPLLSQLSQDEEWIRSYKDKDDHVRIYRPYILKLIAVAKAAEIAQRRYRESSGDWFDLELDDALTALTSPPSSSSEEAP